MPSRTTDEAGRRSQTVTTSRASDPHLLRNGVTIISRTPQRPFRQKSKRGEPGAVRPRVLSQIPESGASRHPAHKTFVGNVTNTNIRSLRRLRMFVTKGERERDSAGAGRFALLIERIEHRLENLEAEQSAFLTTRRESNFKQVEHVLGLEVL